jgi:hypothetical protein
VLVLQHGVELFRSILPVVIFVVDRSYQVHGLSQQHIVFMEIQQPTLLFMLDRLLDGLALKLEPDRLSLYIQAIILQHMYMILLC